MYFYRKRENRSSRRKPSKHRRQFQIYWRDRICSGHLQTQPYQQQLLTSCYLHFHAQAPNLSRRKPKNRRRFQIYWRDRICSGHLQTRSCQQQLLTSCYLYFSLNLSTQSNFFILLCQIIFFYFALPNIYAITIFMLLAKNARAEPTYHKHTHTTTTQNTHDMTWQTHDKHMTNTWHDKHMYWRRLDCCALL
jgi:hypothetical protein